MEWREGEREEGGGKEWRDCSFAECQQLEKTIPLHSLGYRVREVRVHLLNNRSTTILHLLLRVLARYLHSTVGGDRGAAFTPHLSPSPLHNATLLPPPFLLPTSSLSHSPNSSPEPPDTVPAWMQFVSCIFSQRCPELQAPSLPCDAALQVHQTLSPAE